MNPNKKHKLVQIRKVVHLYHILFMYLYAHTWSQMCVYGPSVAISYWNLHICIYIYVFIIGWLYSTHLHVQEDDHGVFHEQNLYFSSRSQSPTLKPQSWIYLTLPRRDHSLHTLEICILWIEQKTMEINTHYIYKMH